MKLGSFATIKNEYVCDYICVTARLVDPFQQSSRQKQRRDRAFKKEYFCISHELNILFELMTEVKARQRCEMETTAIGRRQKCLSLLTLTWTIHSSESV